MSDKLIEAVAKAVADSDRMQLDPKVYEPRYLRYARAALAAIEASGYAVVPVEPTEAMLKALNEYAMCAGYIPEGYTAMLSARPEVTP